MKFDILSRKQDMRLKIDPKACRCTQQINGLFEMQSR
jgi:hypothetical protein